MKIAILDYDVGNLFSLKTALERHGAITKIVKSVKPKMGFDAIFLPGVGNFSAAVKRLKQSRNIFGEIVSQGTPVFGICLGMQLFFSESEEGYGRGLELIDGRVTKLPQSVKVPQMGWNTVHLEKDDEVLDGIEDNSWFYFVHSYYPTPERKSVVVGNSTYGIAFPSIVRQGKLFGTQFHPEKSGDVGSQLLRNFLSSARR